MRRPERMAEALREAITEIVSYELEDPRVHSASVTEVRLSENGRDAKPCATRKNTCASRRRSVWGCTTRRTFISSATRLKNEPDGLTEF